MNIQFFCPRWGSEALPFKAFVNKVKASGYDGVEMSFPLDKTERDEMVKILKDHNLLLISQHYESIAKTVGEYKEQYKRYLYNLIETNPLFINSQSGKDFFSFKENLEVLALANEISKETGVKIVHETHRGKLSFAANITKKYLEELDELYLTTDFSHWTAVAESDDLEYQEEAVELAIQRSHHLHARVGFSQGPQIPDPRTPEWQDQLNVFLNWWKRIVEARKRDGWDSFTITPEFGPIPYMPKMPFTKNPISNQWEINVFIKNLLKKDFDL